MSNIADPENSLSRFFFVRLYIPAGRQGFGIAFLKKNIFETYLQSKLFMSGKNQLLHH
jgi:hypothetical protein